MDHKHEENIIKNILPEKRFQHVLRVRDTALDLAGKYGEDKDKTETAALLHDIAKYFEKDTLFEIIHNYPGITDDLLNYSEILWHGPAGAVYVKENYGVVDQDIFNAITYHTTGRRGMSRLEKIIFLADYIEPGRDFPGVDETRTMAGVRLDLGVAKALSNMVKFLVSRSNQVYPDTINAYNELIKIEGGHLNER